jgi:acyl carrier protein
LANVSEKVKKILIDHLGVDAEKITPKARFAEDLGADSLDAIELVIAFEEQFGCEIPDNVAESIQTVGDAIKFLEQNANSSARSHSR